MFDGFSDEADDRMRDGAELATSLSHATMLEEDGTTIYDDLLPQPTHQSETSHGYALTGKLLESLKNFEALKCDEAALIATLHSIGKEHVQPETQEYTRDISAQADLIKACINDGGKFPLRDHPVGRMWSKAIESDPDLKKRYIPLKTRAAKAALREQWLSETYEKVTKGKTYTKSWHKIDKSKGKYYNFGMLVEQFGINYDRHGAVISATKHADKCFKMGGDWVRWDKMAEVPEFLKLHKEFHENMVEAWDSWAKEHNGEVDAGPGPSGARGRASPRGGAQQTSNNANSSGGNTSGPKKRAASNTNEKQDTKKPKVSKKNQDLDRALADAVATKKVYSTAMSRAENLVTLIESSSEWGWARTTQSVGALRDMVNKVKFQIGENPSMSRFILEDVKDLRRDVGADALTVMATDFSKLKPSLDEIDSKQSSLVAGHKSLKA